MALHHEHDHDHDREYGKDEKVQPLDLSANEVDHEYNEYVSLSEEFSGDALKKLTRKIDIRVVPQLIFIYMLSYIDRGNVGNARLFGAQADTGLSNTDWNTGLSLLFITFGFGGLPSNILVKKFGPKKVLPVLLIGVGAILMGAGFSHNRAQWFTLRILLGLFEAGMYPGCTYTLTTWYTPAQIHSRTTIYYLGGVLSGALSGLLAYGIGQLDGKHGWRGWRYIYVTEGGFTLFVGIVALFTLQETPQKTKKWLNDREKRFLLLRSKYLYGGGRMGSKDDFSLKDVAKALKSAHVWIISFCFICNTIALYGFSLSLPTIVKNMGFTAANAQALSAPPYVFAAFCVVGSGLFSDRYRQRAATVVFPSIIGFVIEDWLTWDNLIDQPDVGTCIAAGGLYCLTPALTVWAGLNTAGQTKRAAAISIVFLFAAIGGIPGSYIYLAKEAPGYPTGFGVSLGLMGFGNIIVPALYWLYCGWINKKREQMSSEEIHAKYSQEELEEMGDLSPLYRYER
uniref:Major facilitator superfamily (MFS) profile domain-containing protein n=1 Tax=Kwoniella dejecticola CBS 10117 TaxID=1296121 RepID=A0A1A6AA14_9TREE|nr:uncharacterized protein I303_02918 [Kwoniella dejecticola CBS 10117]OBR86897.1 hypothetical protein I303_02918 [Kwoniella dejecticola CBS 10117]